MTRVGVHAKRTALRDRVVDLVADGSSLTATAAQLGIGVAYCGRLFSEGVALLPQQSADALLGAVELRLDRLSERLAPLTMSDDERIRLQAIQAMRQIESDRVRALGLALPTVKGEH